MDLVKKIFLFEEENYFEVEIKTKAGKAVLHGTPDLYIPKRKELWDFKTGKYFYEIQKLLAGDFSDSKHIWQTNIYRHFKYPEAEKIFLEMVVKDYKMDFKQKFGIEPVVIIPVPVLKPAMIENIVKKRIEVLLEIEKDSKKVQNCLPGEIWDGVRCESYCDVIEYCEQGKRILEERKRSHAKSK